MMAKADVVQITTRDGELVEYRLLSARIPEFRERYPVGQGYRVRVEALDAIAAKPGLLALYQEAVRNGIKPGDAGLPAIAGGEVMLFRASLLDEQGNELETASALKPILSYKDWEAGETAARQRLLAALGIGGEVFDRDERQDMRDQGVEPGGKHPSVPEAQSAHGSGTGPGVAQRSIPRALVRQIAHQAALRGQAVPEYDTIEQARKALKALLQA